MDMVRRRRGVLAQVPICLIVVLCAGPACKRLHHALPAWLHCRHA